MEKSQLSNLATVEEAGSQEEKHVPGQSGYHLRGVLKDQQEFTRLLR